MMLFAGCLFPRYTTIGEMYPTEAKENAMTLEEASKIVKEALENIPAGHHPQHPGDANLGKYATSVKLRTHNRTGLVLVEVFEGSRIRMEFYVRTQADGEKFAAAVWRLRQEYGKK